MIDLDPALVRELERIAPAGPVPVRRWHELAPRRRRAAVALVSVAVAAAAITALAAPWRHGPAALSAADAARVVRRTAAVVTMPRRRVLHTRAHVEVAGAHGVAWSGDEERWVQLTGAKLYRIRTDFPNLHRAVELGGTYGGNSPTYVLDPENGVLYFVPIYSGGTAFVDPVALAKAELRGNAAVRRVTVDGRRAYRLETYRAHDTTELYVDARTYRPLRSVETISGAQPFELFAQKPRVPLANTWRIVTDYTRYEYLRTPSLASIVAQHPRAPVRVNPAMPKSFKARFRPWTGP